MSSYKQLRYFKLDELIFNEEETRAVLKFIFKPADHEIIDSLPMSDYLRGFAQGLLLEAIDASYAIGYVESLFRSVTNPGAGAKKLLKKFGKKALKHWFKHVTAKDLQNIKVYDFVRDNIARGFRTSLRDFLASITLEKKPGAFLSYKRPSYGHIRIWG